MRLLDLHILTSRHTGQEHCSEWLTPLHHRGRYDHLCQFAVKSILYIRFQNIMFNGRTNERTDKNIMLPASLDWQKHINPSSITKLIPTTYFTQIFIINCRAVVQ